MKNLLIVLTIAVILIGGYFVFFNEQQIEIDCNTFGVIYLKPSESHLASGLANKINGIVVIPEENSLIARSEILDCPNFDYSEYIDTGGLF
ncbi:MAG TPA: hypothetical protein PLU55_04330 [Candidatus Pacearchaeota archaeon]|nr:hypothetical protein [Candidatus Pacearchaeota archaeon]